MQRYIPGIFIYIHPEEGYKDINNNLKQNATQKINVLSLYGAMSNTQMSQTCNKCFPCMDGKNLKT